MPYGMLVYGSYEVYKDMVVERLGGREGGLAHSSSSLYTLWYCCSIS